MNFENKITYLTDDVDIEDTPMELRLSMGANGDWYIEISPKGERLTHHVVRITTSGSRRPGLAVALAKLYYAMAGGDTTR